MPRQPFHRYGDDEPRKNKHTDMKDYSILIKGSGPCGTGNEESADILLLELMKSLQNSGHKLGSVSIQADGILTIILGGAEEHPAGDTPLSDTITLATLSDQLTRLDKKLSRFEAYEKKSDKAKDPEGEAPRKRGKKNEEGGAGKVAPEPENKTPDASDADEKTANAGTSQEGETGASAQTQSAGEEQTQETQGTTEGTTEGDTQTAEA